MKTVMSVLVALSVVAGLSASAGATFDGNNAKRIFKEIEDRSRP